MVERIRSTIKSVGLYKCLLAVGGFFAIAYVLFSDFKARIMASADGSRWIIVIFIGAVVLIASALLGLFAWQNKHRWDYSKCFLAFSILLGSLYILIAPLGSGNDDPSHYYRIYEISQGRMVSVINNETAGGQLPKSFTDLFRNEASYGNLSNIYSAKMTDETSFYSYPNTALYSPISYIPQVVGMSIGKAVNASPFWLGTLARVFNLAFYIVICFLGFRLITRFKLFFLILLLSPSILSCATSFSADAFVVALTFLFVAVVLHLKTERKIVDVKYMALLIIMSILIAGCKITYLPVVFLILILDKQCFRTRWKGIAFKASCIIVGLAVSVVWMKIVASLLEASYPLAGEQMSYVLHNPLSFVVAFVRTMTSGAVSFIENIFSSPMYHSRVNFYSLIRMAFVVIAILALANETRKNKLNKHERSYFCLVAVVIVVAIAGALYTQWTSRHCNGKIGCDRVMGIQGRYFIPALTVGLMAIGKPKYHIGKNSVLLCFLALQLFSMMTMATVFVG